MPHSQIEPSLGTNNRPIFVDPTGHRWTGFSAFTGSLIATVLFLSLVLGASAISGPDLQLRTDLISQVATAEQPAVGVGLFDLNGVDFDLTTGTTGVLGANEGSSALAVDNPLVGIEPTLRPIPRPRPRLTLFRSVATAPPADPSAFPSVNWMQPSGQHTSVVNLGDHSEASSSGFFTASSVEEL